MLTIYLLLRQKLTISLGVMENPHSSSEEDLLSAGLDAHVPAPDEEMYEPRQNEEYATTFEYPGMMFCYLLCCCCCCCCTYMYACVVVGIHVK